MIVYALDRHGVKEKRKKDIGRKNSEYILFYHIQNMETNNCAVLINIEIIIYKQIFHEDYGKFLENRWR